MRRRILYALQTAVFVIIACLAFSPLLAHAGEETVYELSRRSAFREGCAAPCTCPVKISVLSGGFTLIRSGAKDGLKEFDLGGISWRAAAYNGKTVHKITGAGTYRITGKTHRLTLDVEVDGRKARYDTGFVPDGSRFPAIEITAGQGGRCFDTWIDIDATPRPPSPGGD